jgi:hypothetical protein
VENIPITYLSYAKFTADYIAHFSRLFFYVSHSRIPLAIPPIWEGSAHLDHLDRPIWICPFGSAHLDHLDHLGSATLVHTYM